jgi:deoxyadenosine/deoxycytidine kinase
VSYIAIEGPIGSGKTTLARLLADRIDAKLLLEAYEENPFLRQFYDDRKRYAFQTQLFFLLSRFRQQKALNQTDLFYENVISDYIFSKDRLFAAINLSEDELSLYDEVERTLTKAIPVPDVVIYLQSSVPHLMEGISRRGRQFEEPITAEYLAEVVRIYDDYFFHYRASRLIVVDTDQIDFYSNPDLVELVLDALYRRNPPPVEYLGAALPVPMFSNTPE